MRIIEDVSFKDLTTFKVGGFAKKVVYPETKEEIQTLIKDLNKKGEKYVILGDGSNVLPSDDNFDGTVVIPSFKDLEIKNDSIVCGAGFDWDNLVLQSVEKNLWGLENLSAIPGTVGGAVFQNIGAYGAVLSDTLESVFVYNIKKDRFEEILNKDCLFGYRTSLFKKHKNEYVILEVKIKLKKEPSPNTEYKDLKEVFKDKNPSLLEIREAVIKVREGKFPPLNKYGTAGSFFLNPVVKKEEAERFKERFPEMPLFVMPEGGIKIPLAWILDNVIFAKTFRDGNAFVWNKQALVIATEEGATSNDIKRLAEKIKKEVKDKINLEITFEVNFL